MRYTSTHPAATVSNSSNQMLRLSLAMIELLLPFSIAAISSSSFGVKGLLCQIFFRSSSSIKLMCHKFSKSFTYPVHSHTHIILSDPYGFGYFIIGYFVQRHHDHGPVDFRQLADGPL